MTQTVCGHLHRYSVFNRRICTYMYLHCSGKETIHWEAPKDHFYRFLMYTTFDVRYMCVLGHILHKFHYNIHFWSGLFWCLNSNAHSACCAFTVIS